jgi:hypothetical protein
MSNIGSHHDISQTTKPNYFGSEISGCNNNALKLETKYISEALKRLFIFQNKLSKPELIAEWSAELSRRKYGSQQVWQALKNLEDESLIHIDFATVIKALESIPKTLEKELCMQCGDINDEGEFIASGYIVGLEILASKVCYEKRLACTCSKGRKIAEKSKILAWNGKDIMTTKLGHIKIFDKHSREYPANLMAEQEKCFEIRKNQQKSLF